MQRSNFPSGPTKCCQIRKLHESHSYPMTKPNTCPFRVSAMLSAIVPRFSLKYIYMCVCVCVLPERAHNCLMRPTDPLQSQFRLNISHNIDCIPIPAVVTSFLTITSPVKLCDVTTLHHYHYRIIIIIITWHYIPVRTFVCLMDSSQSVLLCDLSFQC